jgi:hypothetical protein
MRQALAAMLNLTEDINVVEEAEKRYCQSWWTRGHPFGLVCYAAVSS